MKLRNITIYSLLFVAMLGVSSCHDLLDELPENTQFTGDTDYSQEETMKMSLIGTYAELQARGWEDLLLLSVRGDDVNHGGEGDQQDFAEIDKFNYNKDYWMINSLWQNTYKDIFYAHTTIELIEESFESVEDEALALQYIAEAKVIRGFLLLQLTRTWGDVFITTTSNPNDLLTLEVSPQADVLAHISSQMDETLADLPDCHPSDRTDIKGGVTKYTALAIKALANLDLKNYQEVASATSAIISSGVFELESDFYELFKIKGKLNKENIFELQYSDYGQASGDANFYSFSPFGPQGWSPKVEGASGGWGFFEPSMKWIKFMLDRNEQSRLQTSVLFTDRGIAEIKTDPAYATLPSWISNTTPSGDKLNDYARAMFASGKHYLPSDQLTTGRKGYGNNKNLTCIRFAEILLMHAEALTQGATSSSISADEAVNMVRSRAGLSSLSGVTQDQILDEKFAELAMEWGTRFYDMVRVGRESELNYEGRSFSSEKTFLPYPQQQVDITPPLQGLN